MATTTKPKLTRDQKMALAAYEYALRQEDRYLGSVLSRQLGSVRSRQRPRPPMSAVARSA